MHNLKAWFSKKKGKHLLPTIILIDIVYLGQLANHNNLTFIIAIQNYKTWSSESKSLAMIKTRMMSRWARSLTNLH